MIRHKIINCYQEQIKTWKMNHFIWKDFHIPFLTKINKSYRSLHNTSSCMRHCRHLSKCTYQRHISNKCNLLINLLPTCPECPRNLYIIRYKCSEWPTQITNLIRADLLLLETYFTFKFNAFIEDALLWSGAIRVEKTLWKQNVL